MACEHAFGTAKVASPWGQTSLLSQPSTRPNTLLPLRSESSSRLRFSSTSSFMLRNAKATPLVSVYYTALGIDHDREA